MGESCSSPDCLGKPLTVNALAESLEMRDTGVSPCFVNCGEPACQALGCVRVYNARHRDA